MMLYDVFYWSAKSGRRLAGFDRCTATVPARAPKGQLAHCVCVNWDGHHLWIDDQGYQVEAPDFALSDREWVVRHIGRARFSDPSYRQAVLDAAVCRYNDPVEGARYDREFASMRRKIEAGETITLYQRAQS